MNATVPYNEGVFDGTTNVITGCLTSVVSALSVNDFVYGYGIPKHSYVTSKPLSSSLALSNNTTVALTWGQFVGYSPQNAFLRAVKRSRAWANALWGFHNSFGANPAMPSAYVQLDVRWGHAYPTAYDYGNTEWGDLDLAWRLLALRDKSKRQMVLTT